MSKGSSACSRIKVSDRIFSITINLHFNEGNFERKPLETDSEMEMIRSKASHTGNSRRVLMPMKE